MSHDVVPQVGPRYGIEAPYVPVGLSAGGLACLAASGWPRTRWLAVPGIALLAQAGLYLHTTIRGKLRIWQRELDRLGLRGDEGCSTWAAAAVRC